MKAYLLDTNVFISLFSKYTVERTRQLLKKLGKSSILHTCGIVLAEFYQGIEKNDAEYYSVVLNDFPYLHSAREIYEKAGLNSQRLKKLGRTIPLGDCLIAETAKKYRVTLVTFDKHLRHYPRVQIKFFKMK